MKHPILNIVVSPSLWLATAMLLAEVAPCVSLSLCPVSSFNLSNLVCRYNQYTSITNLCASVPPHEGTNPVNPVNPVQESSAPPSAFTYDADGNMTADERGWHYVWNGENRLVCASNDEVVVTYAYDHRGRMVRKEISHGDTETRRVEYLWDDWNIIREIQWPVTSDQWSVGTLATSHYPLVTDYVWGLDLDGTLQGAGGVGGLLAVVRSNSSTPNSSTHQLYFPTYDANGNISEYVSESGEIVAHYDYSPFGEPLVAFGPLAATFTHQFSTKPHCSVTGFSEYQMRKYNPAIGRWMSRDPIEEIGGENLYGFCGNSAITTSDIRGQGFWPEKDMCKCNQWLTEEVKDLKWLLSLPNCPCKLAFDKSNRPIRPKGWPSMDNPADQTYHPGARYCIRSSPVGHARQQCCYDEKGALITWGGGAGTPDKESDLFKHKANDVNPYYTCGKSWKLYNFARPPNNGNNCAENPLNPPHGPGF